MQDFIAWTVAHFNKDHLKQFTYIIMLRIFYDFLDFGEYFFFSLDQNIDNNQIQNTLNLKREKDSLASFCFETTTKKFS